MQGIPSSLVEFRLIKQEVSDSSSSKTDKALNHEIPPFNAILRFSPYAIDEQGQLILEEYFNAEDEFVFTQV